MYIHIDNNGTIYLAPPVQTSCMLAVPLQQKSSWRQTLLNQQSLLLSQELLQFSLVSIFFHFTSTGGFKEGYVRSMASGFSDLETMRVLIRIQFLHSKSENIPLVKLEVL